MSGLPAIDLSTRLALDRTRAAHERTMLAWVRTATSLITFGFTIYKFFQIELARGVDANRLVGPRGFAIMTISVGLISLILATLQHEQNMRALKAQYSDAPRSMAKWLGALISVLGIFALIAVVLRQ
jgi:inner membrane protein YidH